MIKQAGLKFRTFLVNMGQWVLLKDSYDTAKQQNDHYKPDGNTFNFSQRVVLSKLELLW